MATITKTAQKTTDWKFPTVAKQDGDYSASDNYHSFKFSGNTPILCRNNSGDDYVGLYSKINKSSYATHTIYCSGFNFKNEIPSNASIDKIHVKITDRVNTSSGGATCYVKLVRAAGTSSGGFGNQFTRALSSAFNESEFVKNATNGGWATIDIGTDIVNSDNFGVCFYYKGTSSTYVDVHVAYVQIRVTYTYSYTVEVTAAYSTSLQTSKLDLSTSQGNGEIYVFVRNSNSVAGSLSGIATISDVSVCKFANTSSNSSTITQSIGAGNTNESFKWGITPLKEGSTTITVQIAGQTYTIPVTVTEDTPTLPTYSASVSLLKNTIVTGEIIKATVVIQNTNNIAGTFEGGNLSSNNSYFYLLLNTTLQSTLQIPSQTISAGGSYTVEAYIKGASAGTGNLTLTSSQLTTQTKKVTVNGGEGAYSLSILSSDNGFYVDNSSTVTVIIENNGNDYLIDEYYITLDDHLIFSDGTRENEYIFHKSQSSFTDEVTVKGVSEGDSVITVKIVTDAGEYTLSKTFTVGPKPTITGPEYSFDTLEVNTEDYITVTAKYTNTSESVGYTPVSTITLPEGLTAMNGGQSLTFPATKIKSLATVSVTNLIVASSAGTYELLLNNKTFKITVKEIITQTPIFGNNWAMLTKTELYAKDTAQLILNYRVTNNVYPATLSKTTITLPENVTFTDGSSSKTIDGIVLNEGESYNNENNDSLYIKFNKIGTGVINVSNETLGTTLINITTNPEPAQLSVSFDDSLTEVTHNTANGVEIPLVIDFKNTGGVEGTFKDVVLQLSGDVLEFENGTQKITYSEITVNPESVERRTIKMYTTSDGTGQLKITEKTTNYTATKTIKINKLTTPEYDYSFSIEPPKIPIYTNKEQITSQLKILIKNTNNIAGNFPELYVQLDDDLSFSDDSKAYSITGQSVSAQGEYEYILPLNIKGVATGAKNIDVRIKGGDYIANLILNILGSTIRSYGNLNLDTCKFLGNNGMLGGAIYNTSNMTRKDCTFEDNTSTDKCNNIYNNGGCE